jgi:hypothetical protein
MDLFQDPIPTAYVPGPWFEAGFSGECSRGGEEINPGDTIRADGYGEWECQSCVEEDG